MYLVYSQEMEFLWDYLFNTQNGILPGIWGIARIEGVHEAKAAPEHFRRWDVLMRNRLFILQLWRKHVQDVKMHLSSVKAGENLDPDLAKLLKDKQKSERKIQRDLVKAKNKLWWRWSCYWFNLASWWHRSCNWT